VCTDLYKLPGTWYGIHRFDKISEISLFEDIMSLSKDEDRSVSDWEGYSQHSVSTTFTAQRENERRVNVSEAANDVYFEDQILWGNDPNKSYFDYMMETEKEYSKTLDNYTIAGGDSMKDDATRISKMIPGPTIDTTFDSSATSSPKGSAGNVNGFSLENEHLDYHPPAPPRNGAILVVAPNSLHQSLPTNAKDVPSVIYLGGDEHPQTRRFGFGSGDTTSMSSFLSLPYSRRLLAAFVFLLFLGVVLSTTFIALSLQKSHNTSPNSSLSGGNNMVNSLNQSGSASPAPTMIPVSNGNTTSPTDSQFSPVPSNSPTAAPFRKTNAPTARSPRPTPISKHTHAPAPNGDVSFSPSQSRFPYATRTPTVGSTLSPSQYPTYTKSLDPTSIVSLSPTPIPSPYPSLVPSSLPTDVPTPAVTSVSATPDPTHEPTSQPSLKPTNSPTPGAPAPTNPPPTFPPSPSPTDSPTTPPATLSPSVAPTIPPTVFVPPTMFPTVFVPPTLSPTVFVPPTLSPTIFVPPTITPFRFSTESPTLSPSTLSPSLTLIAPSTTTVDASIQVDKSTYMQGEKILVTFKNIPPLSNDWIAMQDVTNGVSSTFTAAMWVNTCGTQTCQGASSGGTISFGPEMPGFAQLNAGTYLMRLLRGTGSNLSFAKSAMFTIVAGPVESAPAAAPV